jgi:putative membrane protein
VKAGLLVAAKGFCMGAADVVPGVSGGTMALVLGIYERLLKAIRAFDTRLLRELRGGHLAAAAEHVDLLFLVPLGIGIVAALAFFTRVVGLPGLVQSHPELVYALFFGLVVGSIVFLIRSLAPLLRWDLVSFAAGIVLGLMMVRTVPFETPEHGWFIFLSGALAICAMILPGISGAFILLVLRKYAYVFDAIARLDLAVLVPFALGAVCGLMLFSRLLVWLLRHYHRRTLSTIIGVLTGSLWLIWPFQERTYEILRGSARLVHSAPVLPGELSTTVLLAGALALAGFILVLAIEAGAGGRRRAPGGVD